MPLFPGRSALQRRLGSWKNALTVKAMVPVSLLLSSSVEPSAVGIITYHRITPRPDNKPAPPLNVTPDRFRHQLAGLRAKGFVAQSLQDVLDHYRTGRPLPAQSFVVVFDDGYENLYHHAWPILRELQIPATIFLATAYVDSISPLPFDEWSWAGSTSVPAESWRMLTIRQCREMARDGRILFGSHTHRHEDFRGRCAEFRRDLDQSFTFLRTNLQVEQPTFALPYGFLDSDMLAILRNSAAPCCLTSDSQLIRPDSDPHLWGRFGAEQYDTPATLAAKLNGVYSRVQNLWRRLRPGYLSHRAHEQAYFQSHPS